VDDGGHLDAGELLAVNGYHATPENSAMLLKVAREVAAEHAPSCTKYEPERL
jgi:hypothetical protein